MSTELLTSLRHRLRLPLMPCLLTVIVLVFSVDASLACTCMPSQNATQELKRATAVFSGKVLKVKRHKLAEDMFARVEAVFDVEQVWKGIAKETVSVFTSSTSIACGYGFKEGRTYLVYAYEDAEERLSTSICSRTKRLGDARQDLDELGKGKVIAQSASDDAGSYPRSEQFTKEVQDLARQFAQRLKETREFRPEGDKLFVDHFVKCHLWAEIERKENAIFMQISASITPAIASQASDKELRRYLIAQLNFFHLKTLHRMSTRDLEGKWARSFYAAEQDFPPGVYDLLMKNPAIAAVGGDSDGIEISASIKDVHQLRSILPTFEQAMSAMREYFMAHPPEEAELYKKNMQRIGNHEHHRKFWEVSFHKIPDKDTKDDKEGRRCLGFSPRLIAYVKIPPFYSLVFFQTGSRFKIGSLFCTEPPCVD